MKNFTIVALSIALFFITTGWAIKIEIIHWNDVSGQIESFKPGTANSSSGPVPCGNGETNCIGGVARLVHHISEPPAKPVARSLRLSSGNLVGGESGWLPVITWNKYGEFIREHVKPDVVALGMKEFGAGIATTISFMNEINNGTTDKKTVVANTCDPAAPEQAFCNAIIKLKKITIESGTIGVIGFVTPTVERLSLPGKLEFWDVATKIQETVDANADIQTFIAIGDGTLDMSKEIIDKVPKVKLVVYSAGFFNTRDMTNDYPLKYNNGYIATAGRYGSSVGRLIVDWEPSSGSFVKDDASKLVRTSAQTFNTAGFEANRYVQLNFTTDIDIEKGTELGHTRVTLQGGEKCWRQECNLGNFVTDAMVHCAIMQPPVSKPIPHRIHSIWHGGAFFEDEIKPGGRISKFDVHKWLPYHNRAHLVKVTGSNLRRVFEESAKGINPERANAKDWRQFLQVSNGMEVYYDSHGPSLIKVRMVNDNSGTPELIDLQDNAEYYFVIPTYLYEGRGVYEFAGSGFWVDAPFEGIKSSFAFDDDCVMNYTLALRQISVGFEERIWIDGSPSGGGGGRGDGGGSCDCKCSSTAVTVILTIVIFSIILAAIFVGYFFVLPRLRKTNHPTSYPPNQL